jgi:hypothetical protein
MRLGLTDKRYDRNLNQHVEIDQSVEPVTRAI